MFNKQNFCHVASNNRNEQKAGIFVYRTTDNLQTVTASGYFNEKLVDINLHDLIIHEQTDNADKTKVVYNILCVTERTLDNVGTQTILTDWEKALVVPTKLSDLTGDVAIVNPTNGQQLVYNSTTQKWENAAGGSGLPDQTGNAGKFLTTDGTDASWGTTLTETLYLTGDNTQEKIIFNDGNNSSHNIICRATYNGGLLFGYRNGGTFRQEFGFSWLWNAFYPINWQSSAIVTLGTSNYKWSNVYTNKLNNGADIEVPNQAGTMVVADPTGATEGQVLTLDANGNAKWEDASSGGAGHNVGDIFFTIRNDNELNGAVECDGATYNTTDFIGAQSIGALLTAGKLDYVSLSAYSTAISTKGWCDKIGWDGTGNTQFRVPTLNAHIVQTNNIPVVGNGMTLGLSDGNLNVGLTTVGGDNVLRNRDGVYGVPYGSADAGGTSINGKTLGITTDPTKSGIIADTSDTAQLRVMIQLATSATDEALETCTSVLADVANLKDHRVIAFQAPTAQNNYTWYRKYADGWVEQGGHYTHNNVEGIVTTTLAVEMADTHYNLQITKELGSAADSNTDYQYISSYVNNSKTTTSFQVRMTTANRLNGYDWQVSGMSAS